MWTSFYRNLYILLRNHVDFYISNCIDERSSWILSTDFSTGYLKNLIISWNFSVDFIRSTCTVNTSSYLSFSEIWGYGYDIIISRSIIRNNYSLNYCVKSKFVDLNLITVFLQLKNQTHKTKQIN